MPCESPVIVAEVPDTATVPLPETVYDSTGPPAAGAVQDKDAASAPVTVAVTPNTAPGIALGVADASADAPGPDEFSALSWKVWDVPLARLPTVCEVVPAPLPEMSDQAP